MKVNSLQYPHHQQTIMVQIHQDSCEEGTTKPIQETGKIGPGSSSSKGSTAAPSTGCITAWYGKCSVSDRKALQIKSNQMCLYSPSYIS